MFVRTACGGWGVGLAVALSVWVVPAAAQVKQTDAANTPLPQPVPMAEASLVNDSWAWNANTTINRDRDGTNLNPGIKYGNYYAPPTYPQFVTGDAINLSGLFKWRRETIDPVADAKTWPGYFSAKCGFTAEIVLMGGNCQAQFGWYNVTDPTSKIPPAANEIYPFMKGKPNQLLTCTNGEEMPPTTKTDGFCPLAWDNRHPYNLSVQRWKIVTFPSGDISKDPNYKGGYVGFAVIGEPKCPSNKFSMYEHNERNASGVPWVTTLIYQSTVDTDGFYFAFEDRPMSAADWKNAGADGDFNDLVFYVKGLTCPGSNKPCNTGQFGVCSVGRTGCAPEGQTAACRPAQQASAEICDNLDNDCDGVIDNGNALCSGSNAPICFHGACVASCKNGFPCPLGTTCGENGRCIEPTCASVSCQPGKACRAGACVDPCSGVICPHGSQCQLGECVDPCAVVSCPADRVCEQGACLTACDCRGCDNGLTCGSDGRCVDSSCAKVACPTGTTCQAGVCVDPCANVICPGGGVCSSGTCSMDRVRSFFRAVLAPEGVQAERLQALAEEGMSREKPERRVRKKRVLRTLMVGHTTPERAARDFRRAPPVVHAPAEARPPKGARMRRRLRNRNHRVAVSPCAVMDRLAEWRRCWACSLAWRWRADGGATSELRARSLAAEIDDEHLRLAVDAQRGRVCTHARRDE
jgi:hypothetical protein